MLAYVARNPPDPNFTQMKQTRGVKSLQDPSRSGLPSAKHRADITSSFSTVSSRSLISGDLVEIRAAISSLKDPQFLHGGVGFHFFLFSPCFPGGTYGCWAFRPTPRWPRSHFLLRSEGCFLAFPVVWCWEPSITSPFFHSAPSAAEGRPSIPQFLKKHPILFSPRLCPVNP